MRHPQDREIKEILNYCDRMVEIVITDLHDSLTNNTQIQQVNILADNDFNVANFIKSNPSILLSNYLKQNANKITRASGDLKTYLNLKSMLNLVLAGETEEKTEIIISGDQDE